MTYEEIDTMISSFDLPYAYYQFPEGTGQEPPFVCFFYNGSNDVGADDVNFVTVRELIIELYTDYKDIELEESVEEVIKSNELFFTKDEDFLNSEKMYMVSYTIQLVIDD